MKKRILVVDDDSMNLARTKKILGKEYDVVLADLILMDIEMPKMNGFETFSRIKDLGDEIPVIFLTASGMEDDVVSAIRLGAVNYLKKPYLPQELQKRVSQEFERQ